MPEQIKIIEINNHRFNLLFDSKSLAERVAELAYEISADYQNQKITFLIILKGAFIFASDLIRKINKPCEIYFAEAKSYGNNMVSSGKVELNIPGIDYQDRNILIVEDIIDSGKTILTLTDKLKSLSVNSVRVVSLLSKSSKREVEINVNYIGFEIPDEFVIGYGLDYAEKGRELPQIYSEIK